MPDETTTPRRTSIADFDAAYLDVPPWDIGRPQPALAELVESGRVAGRVIDVGCGTGELTLLAAARGLTATGIDASPRAIALARRKAAERRLDGARFEVADALDLTAVGGGFDAALDSGVFHIFDDGERRRYVDSVRGSLAVGGLYHLLVFSDAEPAGWGPRRVRREELEAAFTRGWRLDSIVPARFEVNVRGFAQAWRATAVRVA